LPMSILISFKIHLKMIAIPLPQSVKE